MKNRSCILIPTTASYLWAAKFTAENIGKMWRDAPDLYFCGVENGCDEAWLGLVDHPKDWVGIAHSAVIYLRNHYEFCFLILDDHPPLWRCNHDFLNTRLPELMVQLNASYVGLNGWGPGRVDRQPTGSILDSEYSYLERVALNFRWKYSLHPALWRISSLIRVLEACAEKRVAAQRTAWFFERCAGSGELDVPETVASGAYRVCGRTATVNPARYWLGRAVRQFARIGDRVGRLLGLRGVATRLRSVGEVLDQYYEGPYPLCWSGLVRKGKLNDAFIRYLRIYRRRSYEDKIWKAAPHDVVADTIAR